MKQVKKRSLSILLAMMLTLGIVIPSAAAAETRGVMASEYILEYYAEVLAQGSGKVGVYVYVKGTGLMTTIGSTQIHLERSVNGGAWTHVASYTPKTVPAMVSSGYTYSKTPVVYPGTAGHRYRALVTCYAGKSNGSDSRVYATTITTAT